MKIGIDYDGTIADTNLMKTMWLKDNLKLDIPPWKTDRTSCIPALAEHMPLEEAERVYNGFMDFIYSGDYAKATPEIPGAISGIIRLAERNELCIVTARPESIMSDSLQWLADKRVLKYFREVHSSRMKDKTQGRILNKQEICEAYNIGVLVDDDERHLKEIHLANLKRILIKNGASNNDSVHEIYVARNWQEVVNEIEKINQINTKSI